MISFFSPSETLSSAAKRLLAARLVRSIAQGALAVDFALYLEALGWSGAAIGGLLTITGICFSAGAVASGILSDRMGRKWLIIFYDSYLVVVGILAALFQVTWVIAICAILGGFGRGASGAAGPFGPVEQAWLAREIPPKHRSRVYSINSALGFYGMAIGALLASSPYFFAKIFPGPASFRPLFALSALCALAVIFIILPAHDAPVPKISEDQSATRTPLLPEEKKSLFVIGSMNTLNASAIGLVGPLINYWFFLKFGVGTEVLGPFQAFTFLITAFAAQANVKLATRFGLIDSVVYSRALGLLLLLLFPIAPTFPIAAGIYVLRSLFNRGTIGNRNAITANMVNPEHAGTAFSTASASAQFPMAIGPIIAGPLIAAGWFDTPFYVAACLQAFYVGLYKKAFKRAEDALNETSREPKAEEPPAPSGPSEPEEFPAEP